MTPRLLPRRPVITEVVGPEQEGGSQRWSGCHVSGRWDFAGRE